MFCNNCGNKNEHGSKFCSKCGAPALQEQVIRKKTDTFAFSIIKLFFKIIFLPITIPLNVMKWGFGIKTLKCPRCDGRKFSKVKPGQFESALPGLALLALGPLGLLAKRPTTLIVCKQCSFSWESR